MKQTAIEWLIQDLSERRVLPDNLSLLRWSIDKAKEMEKEQILDAYWLGTHDYDMSYPAQQYYKDTYEKD